MPPLPTFLTDAYTRELHTRVLSCQAEEGGYAVVLEDTVLYPEGGGQPADGGTLEGLPVRAVRWVGGVIQHLLAEPLEVGQPVRVELDWPRRLDHMQQHSAQHLLTAVLAADRGLQTVAFHLGAQVCDIEVRNSEGHVAEGAGRGVPEAWLREAEERVAAHIHQARPITARWVTVAELEALQVRSRGLPQGFSGPVRLVEIQGVDLNTCGGTHLASTAGIGSLVILGSERLKRATRIHWVAGGRVRSRLRQAEARTRVLNGLLGCGPDKHAAAAQRIQDENKASSRSRRALLGELAGWIGRDLASQPGSVLFYHRGDADLQFLGTVARAALAVRSGRLLLLTCGDRDGAGMFMLAGPADAVAQVGPELAQLLEGRGGGARARYQGRAARLDLLGDVAVWLQARTRGMGLATG